MTEPSNLIGALDRAILRRTAGPRFYERGVGYCAEKRVAAITQHDGALSAQVFGTEPYRAKLWIESGGLGYSCSCPVGRDGACCKHCVAVGLAWIERHEPGTPPAAEPARPTVTEDDVRAHLAQQDKAALVDMLVKWGREDDRFQRHLFLAAAGATAKGLDIAPYRAAIDAAVAPLGYIGYEEYEYEGAHDSISGAEEVVDTIGALLQEGYGAEVIELAEYAVEQFEATVHMMGDSAGYLADILERLEVLHHHACTQAKPDPAALATRLFALELRAEFEAFYGAAATYAALLGETGLAVYRELAEAAWARLPAGAAGSTDANLYGRRHRLKRILEAVARASGDVEAVVAVKSMDLSSAYTYLEIAEIYKEAGNDDKALEWAERGIEACPERTDDRLREFVAAAYHDRSRHDDAMALIWAGFHESPGLERYRALKAHADRVGQWQAWREKALGLLRENAAANTHEPDRWVTWTAQSQLVRVFLWEEDIDAAWAEAQQGGCSESLWLELAGKRARDHPQDALPIYQRQVELTLDRKKNEAYGAAVDLLRTVRGLLIRLDRESDFAPYIESVRTAHKRKRNFMKLLDRAPW